MRHRLRCNVITDPPQIEILEWVSRSRSDNPFLWIPSFWNNKDKNNLNELHLRYKNGDLNYSALPPSWCITSLNILSMNDPRMDVSNNKIVSDFLFEGCGFWPFKRADSLRRRYPQRRSYIIGGWTLQNRKLCYSSVLIKCATKKGIAYSISRSSKAIYKLSMIYLIAFNGSVIELMSELSTDQLVLSSQRLSSSPKSDPFYLCYFYFLYLNTFDNRLTHMDPSVHALVRLLPVDAINKNSAMSPKVTDDWRCPGRPRGVNPTIYSNAVIRPQRTLWFRSQNDELIEAANSCLRQDLLC